MLNQIIRYSLSNRLIILAISVVLLIFGTYTALRLPVDVLPDLNRPRVTVFLEAGGMAPEEVEALVTLPVEAALNGATGVQDVRSSSAIGLGMVFVEFSYGTDILVARQVVNERLQSVILPEEIVPVLGPVSSVMGQIMLIGLTSDTTSSRELRTLADYTIRQRLLSIAGVSQVIPIGGEKIQYQVLLNMAEMNALGISIHEIEEALTNANLNTTGNFFEQGGSEILIRNTGRLQNMREMESIVVSRRNNTPILLSQVAEVKAGARQKRGDASINGKPAVILSIEKQPDASTVELTQKIIAALDELKPSLPADVKVNTEVFRQSDFIENSISNVEHALRDGAILVVIILFLFLLNVRTTLISLTAIPLSLIITALVFWISGIGINTMTLGGLAIAIGELVDDAIVDVENVFRRLKENRLQKHPKPALKVIYEASSEIRNSIVYATIIVVLVFIPLFSLSGMEGRIFAPLGIAYITSITASLLVSLTVTPVLCSYLLPDPKLLKEEKESFLVRWLKKQDLKMLNLGMRRPRLVLMVTGALLILSLISLPFFGTEFLPPFNEGSLTINLQTEAGTSLAESNKIGTIVEKQLLKVPEVLLTARRTGRAELDEHAESVNNSEIEVAFRQDREGRDKDEVLHDIRHKLAVIQGVSINVGQPISHRLDHLLSGVRAQVAIKVFGNDLAVLRTYARQVEQAISGIPGVVDLQVERQVQIPQLIIRPREEALIYYGVQRGELMRELQTLFQGETVSQFLKGQQSTDIVIKLPEQDRNDIEAIKRTLIDIAEGAMIPLSSIADVYLENGPNTINHENTQRRIIISCNVADRDLGSTVKEIREKISEQVQLTPGYYIVYSGQFESQQSATQRILWLSILSLAGIFIVLFSHFRSYWIVLQIMLTIPLALIGSIIAVAVTGGVFSVASLVGLITLTGIASRNGIMMISHYIHLVEHEGERFGKPMIIRGSLERLVPVLMTALVAALALIPLILSKDAPGKEILYPVATVILGGLLSSTLLDIIVTPVVFYLYGKKALRQYFDSRNKHVL